VHLSKYLSGLASSGGHVQVEQELDGFRLDRDSLITIGVFDGVHLGHKYLISQLKELAGQQGLRSIVITFRQHPQEILTPKSRPPFLTDATEKTRLLQNEGVDAVIVLSFNTELSGLSAREFILLLQNTLHMRGLVIGPDFALGKNHEGNISVIRQLGLDMNFSVTVIPPLKKNGDIVSSTAIRHSLAKGDMEKVQFLMGRPFNLHGKVIHGKGRGAGLGFPTVNLDLFPEQAIPGDGVYATLAFVDDKFYHSVTNVGNNPTFGQNARTIEAYLLNYHNNLYEREVRIDFIHKIRGEIKFNSAEELKSRIVDDIQQAGSILSAEAEKIKLAFKKEK
jgi:riboflavin kinase / FMN adenylyltransferase